MIGRQPSVLRILAAGLLVLVLAVLAFVIWAWRGYYAPAGSVERRVVVEVRPGATVGEVATLLRQRGVLRSTLPFRLGARLRGDGARIKQGEYALSPAMSPDRILRVLASGKSIEHRLVIPEGSSIRRISQLLERRRLSDPAGFEAQALRGGDSFHTEFPKPSSSLEGYLFPDTYRVDRHLPPDRLVTMMLARFDEVVWQDLLKRGSALHGKSLHDIITLASLVEGEARRPDERKIIAGVLWNRLNQGWPLQCDATVQYALGDHRERLGFEDLRVESPYNTYLHKGLPPGPINNPGRESVSAVLNPADVPYLYYVARADGRHIFSETYAEHQAAIRRLAARGER